MFVPVTVPLEFERVIRGFYAPAADDVNRVLLALCGLDSATTEDRDAVLSALELHGAGMDFADALHLARSERCESLVSFDRAFARRANKSGESCGVARLR